MKYLAELYHWITTTAILGAILAYWFRIKQRRFDLNQKFYKKIRYTTSDLLTIWNEYAKIEFILKSHDSTNTSVFNNPDLAVQFFSLDKKKLKKVNRSFFNSLESLKQIDIVLFHRLKESQKDFERINREIFLPLLKSQIGQNDFDTEIMTSILDELMEAIELTILETVKHLPRKERKKVKKVLDKHLQEIKKDINVDYAINEIPGFLVKLINWSLRPKTEFTQQEIQSFYSNDTVKWIIDKVLKVPSLRKAILSKNSGIQFILALIKRDEEYLQKVFANIDDNDFQISKQEASIFVDNKDFYLMILGIIQKIEGHVSMKIKRELVKINKGEISLAT